MDITRTRLARRAVLAASGAALAVTGLTACGGDSSTDDVGATDPTSTAATAVGTATGTATAASSTAAAPSASAAGSAPPAGSAATSDAPSAAPAAATVDSILACAQGAGLTADSALTDGLDWTGTVSVYSMDFYQQAANVYVFPDAAAAQQHQDEVFLDGAANPKDLLAANTATVFNRKPRPDQPDTAALLACLPRTAG